MVIFVELGVYGGIFYYCIFIFGYDVYYFLYIVKIVF